MKKNITGNIVAAQTATLSTGTEYGFITVETSDKKYLKLKVDARTKYNTLERGDRVEIEYAVLGNTDILSARKIMKK
jgi:hypothetical protein